MADLTNANAASLSEYFDSAASWNLGSFGAGIGTQVGTTLLGLYTNNKLSKYQERIAKAQARIQANQYAAEAVGYEQTARRVAEAFGMQEYEIIRQQNAYLEDMRLDAAMRGGELDGTNRYVIAEQGREFERGNAYARTANEREQVNYMTAAAQSMDNARNAITSGKITASSIRSSRNLSAMSSLVNLGAGVLNSTIGYMTNANSINLQKQLYGLRLSGKI